MQPPSRPSETWSPPPPRGRSRTVSRFAMRPARRQPPTPALPLFCEARSGGRRGESHQRLRCPSPSLPRSSHACSAAGCHSQINHFRPSKGCTWHGTVLWCVCPVKSQEPRFAQGYAAGLRATLLGWQACCPLRCAALCQSCYELPRHHVLSQTCAEGGKATETITKNTNTKILHYKRQPWSSHTAL